MSDIDICNVNRIKAGKMTNEQVPAYWRAKVEAEL